MVTPQQLDDLALQSRKRGIPIIGPEKAAWLLKLIQQTKPKRILELGTANGYSGLLLSSEGGELTTIEMNETIATEAKENFQKWNRDVQVIVGDAVTVLAALAQEKQEWFDFIFIDFAKKKYLSVLNDCLLLVRKGGCIVADNITMAGCADFREAVRLHPLLETEFISIGDGLSCSRKI
mgnify:CR=1 FL=1